MSPPPATSMRFFQEGNYGWTSCPKCGEAMIAPESSKYLGRGKVGHAWECDKCDHQFETLIRFGAPV